MSSILNQKVLTYKVQMTGDYLYCNMFDNKKSDCIIGKFDKDDEHNFYFDHDVTMYFKCNTTNKVLESRKLHSRYAIVKNEFNKDIKLFANVMYKILPNKIEKLS